MSAEPDYAHEKKRVNLSYVQSLPCDVLTILTPTRDPAGGDKKEVDTIHSNHRGS